MRLLQGRTVDQYLNTIWCIASSRYVKGFVVGYTATPGKVRRSAYRQNGFEHLVILADRLTQAQAHDLEERLQEQCKFGKARGEPYRYKYHERYRALPYYRSAGQGSPNPMAPIHSVYMAWEERTGA